jgi:hypothetical protein
MNDLVALTDARCEVLFLEPAVGDTVKLSWPQAGESFALYFTLPAELPMLAETLRTIGVERLHFHHIHLQPRSILELPALVGAPYDYTLHDYHPICPQYHLVTEDGRVRRTGRRRLPACLAKRPGQWESTSPRGAARSDACCAVRAGHCAIAGHRDADAPLFSRTPIEWPHRKARAPRCRESPALQSSATCRPRRLHVVAACARDARERGLPLTFDSRIDDRADRAGA